MLNFSGLPEVKEVKPLSDIYNQYFTKTILDSDSSLALRVLSIWREKHKSADS